MPRRTKIVCTLGPASSDLDTIRQLIRAGMDVARLNFSHGTQDDHLRMINLVREAGDAEGQEVAILQDLQGPKIRIGVVQNDNVILNRGDRVILTPEKLAESTASRVHVNYDTLAEDVDMNGRILIDDGHIELEIVEINGRDVVTEVVVGGPLRSRKGVNLPNIRTSTPSLTEKDLKDLDFGLEHGVDIIALSFVRDPQDVRSLVKRVRDAGSRVTILSKIEKPEAVRSFDDVLIESDGIMVARGDLGIEMPIAQVPSAQKSIIRKCLASAKPVITATQMLESMIENSRPTRAEASDVANAVLDGSDAVMLSGETAMGRHPVRVVEVMSRIIEEAEKDWEYQSRPQFRPPRSNDSEAITAAVSYTAFELAEQIGAAAVACLTATGNTATQMLESMIENSRPTRAEASDVANAVLDGSDAVMLSGETAMGRHPVRVVEVMSRIIEEAEKDWEYQSRPQFRPPRSNDSEAITAAVSYTAFELAEQIGAAAVACLTATGNTARSVARHRPSMPVYAFTDDERVVRQLKLVWGTTGFAIPFQKDTDEGVKLVHKMLSESGLVRPGEYIVVMAGMPLPAKGRTNMVHVSKV